MARGVYIYMYIDGFFIINRNSGEGYTLHTRVLGPLGEYLEAHGTW